MNKGVYISIKPEHVQNIIKGIKNYEYRNYIPNESIDYLIVYTTSPVGEIQYVIEVDEIIEYPDRILIDGLGNKEFNNGEKTKFAYHINKIFQVASPIKLKELRDKYNFYPPQKYFYTNKNEKLTNRILEEIKELKELY